MPVRCRRPPFSDKSDKNCRVRGHNKNFDNRFKIVGE
jgi:hypothetical protein